MKLLSTQNFNDITVSEIYISSLTRKHCLINLSYVCISGQIKLMPRVVTALKFFSCVKAPRISNIHSLNIPLKLIIVKIISQKELIMTNLLAVNLKQADILKSSSVKIFFPEGSKYFKVAPKAKLDIRNFLSLIVLSLLYQYLNIFSSTPDTKQSKTEKVLGWLT